LSKSLLILAGYFFPHVGGYERSIFEVSMRLVKRGYKIDIITLNTEGVQTVETICGIDIYRLPAWNLLHGTYAIPKFSLLTFRLILMILKNDYDGVITHTRFMPTSFLGLIFSRIKKLPLVHTEHGTIHSIVPSRIVGIIGVIYDHLIGGLIVKSASKNIGVSNAACNFLMHLGAKEPIVIHNGVDISIFRKIKGEIRTELGLDNCIIIAYHGRLIYSKGVQDLIVAFAGLYREFKCLKLLIIGEGIYRKELEGLSSRLCNGGILFLGEKCQKDIVKLLSVTDIFVNPSYSEGLPSSVLEASSIGLPIIATNVGGTSEIINDKNGFLYDPGNIKELEQYLQDIIKDEVLRAELAKNARDNIIKNFTWTDTTNKYDDIYGSICSR